MRNFERDIKNGVIGDPEAVFCGLCDAGRVRVRGTMFCSQCDAPHIDKERMAPTWELTV